MTHQIPAFFLTLLPLLGLLLGQPTKTLLFRCLHCLHQLFLLPITYTQQYLLILIGCKRLTFEFLSPSFVPLPRVSSGPCGSWFWSAEIGNEIVMSPNWSVCYASYSGWALNGIYHQLQHYCDQSLETVLPLFLFISPPRCWAVRPACGSTSRSAPASTLLSTSLCFTYTKHLCSLFVSFLVLCL